MAASLKLLLVEDDPDDVDLFRFALDDAAVDCQVEVVMEGDRVLPFLEKTAELPDVAVLDLNLPKVSGHELLRLLKVNARLRGIPVVVLTTSSAPEDRAACLALGAAQFLTKPTDQGGFDAVIGTILGVALAEK